MAQVDVLPGCHHSPEPGQPENEPRHQTQDPAGCRTTATTPVTLRPHNPTSGPVLPAAARETGAAEVQKTLSVSQGRFPLEDNEESGGI